MAPSLHDSPEPADALPTTPLTFDAELAPAMLAELFCSVEVQAWDAPLVVLASRDAVRDYLIGKRVPLDAAAERAERTQVPLRVTKRGALVFARRPSGPR